MARRPAPLDASDPRLPLGVFQLCGCGERVISAWETACPACRQRSGAPSPTPAHAPHTAPPPPPLPAPLHAPATASTPRPTALHALPPAPVPRAGVPETAPRKTVKLDLAAVRATPVVPAPSPPAASPKRTVMLSLPPAGPRAAAAAELVLAWAPPADEAHEGWTLHGATDDGTPVTLHLRWHEGRWRVLDAAGADVDPNQLPALGLSARGGLP